MQIRVNHSITDRRPQLIRRNSIVALFVIRHRQQKSRIGLLRRKLHRRRKIPMRVLHLPCNVYAAHARQASPHPAEAPQRQHSQRAPPPQTSPRRLRRHRCINRDPAPRGRVRWFMFRRRRFPVEIILVCLRWYCKYGISYRDLTEMMQERAWKWTRPRSCAGSIVMPPSLRSECGRIRVMARRPGAWTRPMSRSVAGGSICSELSISMVCLSTLCSRIAQTLVRHIVSSEGTDGYAELATSVHHHR